LNWKRIFNVSNQLSILRLILAFPICYLIMNEKEYSNFFFNFFIILAIITDYFDGWIARHFNQTTDIGKFLDPFADKVTIGLITLTMIFYRGFPMWLALLIILRDLVIVILGIYILKKHAVYVYSNLIGKWTAFFLALLLISYLYNFQSFKLPLVILSTIFLAWSSISYLRRYAALIKPDRL
jgi:CDP-diacylglycerol--glycerol-3-phosphate 3-phosphatidyltransferase